VSRSRDYLWQIALTLERSHLVSHVTEEMIEQACAELRRTTWCEVIAGVFIVLQVFLPDNCLSFDSELDNVEEAAEVVQMYARATCGEWIDAQARATVLPARADGRWESLDFVCQGTNYHWEFNTATAEGTGRSWQWGEQFALLLEEVLKKHLTGIFFEPWLGGQGTYACYLPRAVAGAFTSLLECLDAYFGWDGFAAFVQAL
jgi:hypothetical protein